MPAHPPLFNTKKPNLAYSTFNVLLLAGMMVICNVCYSQTPDTGQVKKMLGNIDNYNTKLTPEKLYLNFDKPYYAAGDTIWFKIYLLNAATRKASAFSNKVYVELINDSSMVLQTLVIPTSSGLGQGDIKLSGNMREGGYTIRAYTNWMQNFGPEQFFRQRFYIGKPANTSWLVSEQHQTITPTDARQVKMGLQLKSLQGLPVVNQAITMRVLEGRKGILKSDVQTGIDGTINTNFVLPLKADTRKLSLLLEDKADKGKKVTFPFYPRSNNDIDLQFMPEGGSMVAGLYNRVGFKAIGDDGLGVDIEGRIVNSRNEEITTFKSTNNGMGSVSFVPVAGDIYMAKIKLRDGQENSYSLPLSKSSGLVLRVDAVSNPDTIRLYITGTADKAGTVCTLLAQGKNVSYFGTSLKLADAFFNVKIPKDKFPDGIVNFTLFDAGGKAINARNVFIDRHNRLNIGMSTDKPVYATTDSIGLNFKITGQNNNPLQANFSVSVTDDNQVKDALRNQHILSYMLLSSELKGHIENPDRYFDANDALAAKALDNLMLTQGWVGLNVEKANAKIVPEPVFWAERDNSLEGKLKNILNRPAPNRQVTLMSNRHGVFVIDTVSNSQGEFRFSNLPFEDTIAYTIKIHKVNGAGAAVGIDVKEFKPAPPPAPDTSRLMPWYANTDTTLLNYLKGTQKRVTQSLGPVDAQGHMLREVNIKDRKKASLQGVDGEDVYFADADIDEKELTAHGNISLLTYLEKNVKGFYAKMAGSYEYFAMKGNFIVDFIIDGMSTRQYYLGGPRLIDFYRDVLGNTPAAGVKKVVIYHVITRNGKYWVSYVMIQTRSGNGPVLKPTPGSYIYRPLPLYLPREFYRPRYAVKTTQPDLRSTIHWEPNLVSDASGNAALSFYAADKPGTYTVTIEGTDMQGHFGVATRKIKVLAAGTGN